MRYRTVLATIAVVFFATFLADAARAAELRRATVVVVIADDQGYGDLRCHGGAIVRTHNIDRLHAGCVRFTRFHASLTCHSTMLTPSVAFVAKTPGATPNLAG